MLRLVLLGPPGAGKGTHAQALSKQWNIPHISTGDMLREALRAATPLGLEAKQFMERGALVPDEVVIGIVGERLKKNDARQGFVLDGFPRTKEQAESLDSILEDFQIPLQLVIYFKTSVSVIIRRLSGRRICSKCGRTYHLVNFRPMVEGICDDCGNELIQRPDDREEAVENRLQVYEKQTAPLIDYYKKKKILEEVPGDLEVEALNKALVDLFHKKGLGVGSGSQNQRRA
jgi:adenylate kinase